MATVHPLPVTNVSGFPTHDIKWQHLTGGPEFDYPIDYWIAILGGDAEAGKVDFLVKWEPNAYCHLHKHLGRAQTLVLEGEHHLVETSATETVHKVRTAGHVAYSQGGETHMEYGGPQGTVVLFRMEADDGVLFEILDSANQVIGVATVADMVAGKIAAEDC